MIIRTLSLVTLLPPPQLCQKHSGGSHRSMPFCQLHSFSASLLFIQTFLTLWEQGGGGQLNQFPLPPGYPAGPHLAAPPCTEPWQCGWVLANRRAMCYLKAWYLVLWGSVPFFVPPSFSSCAGYLRSYSQGESKNKGLKL